MFPYQPVLGVHDQARNQQEWPVEKLFIYVQCSVPEIHAFGDSYFQYHKLNQQVVPVFKYDIANCGEWCKNRQFKNTHKYFVIASGRRARAQWLLDQMKIDK